MTKPAKGSAALRGCTVLSLMLSTLLQAAFGDIWLLSLVVLGSASIRRVLIPALIGLFGPRMPSDGVGERTPLFYFRRACQVHFCEAMIRILGLFANCASRMSAGWLTSALLGGTPGCAHC